MAVANALSCIEGTEFVSQQGITENQQTTENINSPDYYGTTSLSQLNLSSCFFTQ